MVIDGDFSDWETIGQGGSESPVLTLTDVADMADSSGDLAEISATVEGDELVVTMTAHGQIMPSEAETPEGMTNRYYYHWLIDTDNNPATGVNNSTYENNPTGVGRPLGTEIIVQFGWRNGAPDGIYAYSPLDPDETALVSDYPWEKTDGGVRARLPLEALGLVNGQTVAISAFQEGASDGWATDFMDAGEIKITTGGGGGGAVTEPVEVTDAADLGDSSGDLARITAAVEGDTLVLTMASHGVILPSEAETPDGKTNRYYYHWIIDTDNNPATGVNNSTYENNPTGVGRPIGTEIIVQFGWRNGAPDGVYAYSPLDPDETALVSDYPWEKRDNVLEARIPWAVLNLVAGQTVAVSAFQEGASDGWATDFIDSAVLKIPAGGGGGAPAPVVEAEDPADLGDSSGDLAKISATVEGGDLVLTMAAHGVILPSEAETPEGKTNRYYYHWLIDTDNNPATGVSNATYENNPTGVVRSIGTEIIVQFGWRNGAPDGVYAYSPLDPDETALVSDYPWEKAGGTLTARLPYEALGLTAGQTVSISSFQEGASDGWATDFMESVEIKIPTAGGGGANTNILVVEDGVDDMLDPSGDIQEIRATTDGEFLYLGMTVEGVFGPVEVGDGLTNRYYYHWLIDTDLNSATGVNNATYENNPTGVTRTVGTEIVVQIGWRDGAPDGISAYDPTDPDEGGLVSEFEWESEGGSAEAKLPLAALGLSLGQKVSISAFQEGASDGWATDWMESGDLLIKEPSSGEAIDCATQLFVDAYGFDAVLEDCDGVVIDPAGVTATLDGVEVPVTATKDGVRTTVKASFAEWLQPGGEHHLVVSYPGGASEKPVVVPEHTVIPATYGVSELDGVPRGFVVNVSQVSDFQTGEGSSAHNYDLERAEKQLAGELVSAEGKPFYNEASETQNGWVPASTTVEGIINWAEDAPTAAGYFHDEGTGQPDQPIPMIPGSTGSTNGMVIELLAYLELEPGYHRLGINTIGGYKASMGPDGRDRLSPVLGSYEDSVRYSFLGDKYFDVLVAEPGFYPIRVLFTHVERRNEGASMELFSLKGTRRIAVNDPDDPDAIKAFQFLPGASTYVSAVSPTPGTAYAKPNMPIEVVIEQEGAQVVPGSIRMRFDGAVVNPQVTNSGSEIQVRYYPGSLELASMHEVEFAYTLAGDPPVEREETFTLGVYGDAVVLPPAWASPVSSAGDPGFRARVVQDPGPRGNSISEAEKQLAGQGTFTATAEVTEINFGGGGLFQDDVAFADAGLLEEDNGEYFSMEVLTHLHLKPGAYTFGVNSDDGFVASVGRLATEKTVVLGGWDSGRGIESEPQNLFDVVVRQEGLYAFRLVYFQGFGGAAVEWYQYDRDTETATLLNTEGAVSAFQTRSSDPSAFAEARIAAPERADFGSVPVSAANLPAGFIVHNTGGQALEITGPALTGPDAGKFTLTSFPSSIAPGEAGLFRILFDAEGVPGGYQAFLSMDTNDAAQPTVTVELSAGALDPIGPIAHYGLDETEGLVLRDRSGNQRDGAYEVGEGSIVLGRPALAEGTAVAFGGGSFARASGALFSRWEDFTLSAWVQADVVGGAPQMIFGKGDPFSGNPNFALLFSEAGLLWFVGSEPEPGLASEPGVIQANQKHHVAVSFKTTGPDRVARIYVDGKLVVEKDDPNFIATGVNEPLFFGAFQGAVALDGTLDGIQLYDRPLSGEEVGFLFENPDQPLSSDVPPDPTEGSLPVLSSVVWSSNGLETAFSTEAGVVYELHYSATLQPGSWTVVGSINGDGSVQTFADADPGRRGLPEGFYRVSVK